MRKSSIYGCAVAALLSGAIMSAVQLAYGQGTPAAPAGSGMETGTGGIAGNARGAGGATDPVAPQGFTAMRAGPERVVVMGGKTYLTALGGGAGGGRGRRGGALALPAGQTLTWSKASGPGNVTIENATATATTAKFDTLGDYTIKLTSKLGAETADDTVLVHVVEAAPAKVLTSVPTMSYTLDSPLWNDRIKSHIISWIPHCADLIEHPEHLPGAERGAPTGPGGLDNFIDAGKKLKGEPVAQAHRGYVFSNAWVHNIVESMCLANMVDAKGDPAILKAQADNKATLDRWIPIILAAQEPDGYLQTAHTLGMPGGGRGRGAATQPGGTTAPASAPAAPQGNRMWERWSPASRGNHEGYTMGYFLESAIAHYHLTKGADMRLYNGAKKCADAWVNAIGPEPGKKVWYDGHQEMEKGLVAFGRLVNEVEGAGKGEKYIKLAKFLLDSRAGGSEYDQSHLPIVQQYEAVGHAVRAAYTYAGIGAVMAETNDIEYQSAALSIWSNIVHKKLYVTGGIGSGETSEGFGPNYSLRNNAYCESCSSCGELYFQYNMSLAYQDAKFVSLYEDTIYNALLGNTNLEGTLLCYTNPLSGNNNRQVWQGCPCCVGNTPRALLALPTWTYAVGANDLYVNMFIGSTMQIDKFMGTSVQMVQKTNYPWDGQVEITVNPKEAKHFGLRVAIPNRDISDLYTLTPEVKGIEGLTVNGTAVASPKIEKGYAIIDRDWKAGDKISFNIPLKPQIVQCDPRVAANVGRLAIKYGPLVYNIESVDGNTTTGGLTPNTQLTTEWKPELLRGVMVIKGKFSDGADLVAIPNYARLNRPGTSMVWMSDNSGTAAPAGGRGQPE